MDQWLQEHLACPRDYKRLEFAGKTLVCSEGHQYPIVDGIPIMLLDDVEQTLWVANASIQRAKEISALDRRDDLYIDTLGISLEERRQLETMPVSNRNIDRVVQMIVAATGGQLYKPLMGKLSHYPIPELRLPQSSGEMFLEIGCSWGRWCIAAGRKGYKVVGIDPSLGGIAAARRVSHQLGISARYVVADGRHLPFIANTFDIVFSYSVLQHLSGENARLVLKQIARVLKLQGISLIQMPNMYGLKSLYHQARRRFRAAKDFDVCYWSPRELTDTFTQIIGKTSLAVDGYFGLGIQGGDIGLLPFIYRPAVRSSELLRQISQRVGWMKYLADSLYVKSIRQC